MDETKDKPHNTYPLSRKVNAEKGYYIFFIKTTENGLLFFPLVLFHWLFLGEKHTTERPVVVSFGRFYEIMATEWVA